MDTFPWVSQGSFSDSGRTLFSHRAPPSVRCQPCKASVVMRVLGFTGRVFCTKHRFAKEKNLQFINHSSGKGRLWQMVAVLGVLLEGSSPTLSSFSKHSFPSNHPPPKGWWQLEPPCLSAPPTVTFPPPPLGQGPVHLCRRPAPRLMWLRFPATPLGTWSVLRPVQRLGGRAPPQAVGIQGKHSTPCRTQDTQFRRPILGRGSGVRPRADEAVGCRSG